MEKTIGCSDRKMIHLLGFGGEEEMKWRPDVLLFVAKSLKGRSS